MRGLALGIGLHLLSSLWRLILYCWEHFVAAHTFYLLSIILAICWAFQIGISIVAGSSIYELRRFVMFWLVYHIAYGWGMFHGCLFLLFAAYTHINTSKQIDQQTVWRNTSLRKSFKKTPKQWWSLHNGLGSLQKTDTMKQRMVDQMYKSKSENKYCNFKAWEK